MLTGFAALIVAFYSNQRVVAWWSYVRPFVWYALALLALAVAVIGGWQYVEHRGALEERERNRIAVEQALKEDNERLIRDKQALDAKIEQIEGENKALNERIKLLPTRNKVITAPKASSKVYNRHMNDQFQRFEAITK